jgi:hypothetical protein
MPPGGQFWAAVDTFQRIAPGDDAPLRGVRQSTEWLDEIHLGGLWAVGAELVVHVGDLRYSWQR